MSSPEQRFRGLRDVPVRVQAPANRLVVEGLRLRPADLVVVADARGRRVEHHEVRGTVLEGGAGGRGERQGAVGDGRVGQRVQAVVRVSVAPGVEDPNPDAVRSRGVRENGLDRREVVTPLVAAGLESNRLGVPGVRGISRLADSEARVVGLVQVAEKGIGRCGVHGGRGRAEERTERQGPSGPQRGRAPPPGKDPGIPTTPLHAPHHGEHHRKHRPRSASPTLGTLAGIAHLFG